MFISDILKKYLNQGFSLESGKNLTAEEIFLTALSSSPLAEKSTLKGGIVMYNLSGNKRRVTRDIDFDLLRYPLEENIIRSAIKNLSRYGESFKFEVDGKIVALKHEDYRG